MLKLTSLLFIAAFATAYADDNAEPPIRDQYMEIRKSVLAGPCEESNDAAALEVISYLESHPIDPAKVKSTGKHDYKEFGGSKMDFAKPSGGTGIVEFSYGWKRYQQEIQARQKPYTPEEMMGLIQRVKGLLFDDRYRVLNSYNYSVTPETVPSIKDLIPTLDDCFYNDLCVMPKFTDKQVEFISSVPLYAKWYNFLKEDLTFAVTPELTKMQRGWIDLFTRQAHIDSVRFLDQLNPNIKESEPGSGEIWIAVDLKAFSGKDQRHIHQQIEKVWRTKDLAIRLDEENIKKSKKAPIAFNFYVDEPSKRNHSNGVAIDFYPYTPIHDLAHEFGHILGFKDHYYTFWKNNECEYLTHGDSDDIMGGSSGGKVTDAEWAAIRQAMRTNATPARR